jgi:hypothetical protein
VPGWLEQRAPFRHGTRLAEAVHLAVVAHGDAVPLNVVLVLDL